MTNERTGVVAANGLRAAARTDTGRRHADNEDRYLLDIDAGIFLVVDGIGGHAAGEIAASIAVETIRRRLERQDAPAEVRIREAITLANQQILTQARASAERKGMACVLTLAVLEGRRLTIGHVGDTRLYRFGPDGLAKLTHDHSPIGEREDAREITETEAMQHARRNEVYRDVGSEPREPDSPEFIEAIAVDMKDDWALLLCSDGLSDMLPSLEINRIVRAHAGDPGAVVDALVDAANEAGGRDNITAIYIEAPRFARRDAASQVLPPSRRSTQVATTPLADVAPAAASKNALPRDRPSALGRALRSRFVALAFGTLLGFAAAVGLGLYDIRELWNPREPVASAGTLNVGDGAAGSFARITDALAAARDGDTIRVHPGRYAEVIELRRNVQLISTETHGATLVPPPGEKAFASITSWAPMATVRGFRITGANGANQIGVRVHTGAVEIDSLLIEGPLQVGVDVAGPDSRVTIHATRFMRIQGVPVQVARGSRAALRQNVLHAPAGWSGPAIAINGGELELDANVFVHFAQLISGTMRGTAVPDPAYVIPVPQQPRRGPAR